MVKDYIDREAFLEHMEKTSRYFTVKFDIEEFPAADVAPVVHAQWVVRFEGSYKRRRCYCSHCGKHNGIGGVAKNQEKPYCPNCGALMDGGDNEID